MSGDFLNQPFPEINAPLTTDYDADGNAIGIGKINRIWLQLFMALWNRSGGAAGISTEEALLLAVANEELHRGRDPGLDAGQLLLGGAAGAPGSSMLATLIHDSVVRTIESLGLMESAPVTNDPFLADLLSIPGPPIGIAEDGYYTPTLTNVANLDASTAFACQYLRVKDTVTVSGRVDIDPTAAGATALGISLPFPSNFSAAEQCAGASASPTIAGQSAAIVADATNNRAEMDWIAVDTSNQPMYFSFTYRMI